MDTLLKTMNVSDVTSDKYRLIQPLWDLRLGHEEYLASPLWPIFMSVSFYFLSVTPFMIFDIYGKEWKWIQKYKIQPDKEVTWSLIWKAVKLTLWNHLIFILPITIAQWVYQPPHFLEPVAPTVFQFIFHQLAALAIFDIEYFTWHAIHHKVRFLYRHVHGVHHEYSSPNSWVTQYLHPWELVSVGFFSTTSPWIVGAHPLTEWSFQLFAIIVSVDAHIGYDLPFLPHHWFPSWGGSIKHDMHHQRPMTNFAPFYNYLDRLCGTYCPGQLAGGYKPKELVEWEKKEKQQRDARKLAREQKEKQG